MASITENAGAPSATGERRLRDTTEGELEQLRPRGGFEQRRAIACARLRLFGQAPVLHIGRYRIDGRLGAGGMGEVYLGIDEDLGRRVAIKRVRPDYGDARAQARLRQEARALARLSHANVVQVYESCDGER